jgi:DNA-directed RNA polymerase subunit RPC12/RpoP
MEPSNPLHRHLFSDSYTCPQCGKEFLELQEHLVRGAEGDVLKCPYCQTIFTVTRYQFRYSHLLLFYLLIAVIALYLILKPS